MESDNTFKASRLNKLLAVLLVFALVFNIFPAFSPFDSVTVSEAASSGLGTDTIRRYFDQKMDELGWVESKDMLVTQVNDAMWQDTSALPVWRINTASESVEVAEKSSNTAVGYRVTLANGGNVLDYLVREEKTDTEGAEGGALDADPSGNDAGEADNGDSKGGSVSAYAYSGAEDTYTEVPSPLKESTATGAPTVGTVYYKKYSYSPVNQDDADLYYTIEYDKTLQGCYRQYYVSTADQLATLFYNWQSNNGSLKAVTAEASGETIAGKVGIVLLNDIDLGGRNGESWVGYYSQSSSNYLEIDGQGHTIYNGYFGTDIYGRDYYRYELSEGSEYATSSDTYASYFLGGASSAQHFAIHDVTFSNMYLAHRGGMFLSACYAYFNNVNWTHCLAAGLSGTDSYTVVSLGEDGEETKKTIDTTRTVSSIAARNSIVFGESYLDVHLKDCTIDTSYVAGHGHCALFASFNGSSAYNAAASYVGDTSEGVSEWYYIDAPESAEEAELSWAGKNVRYDAETGKVTADSGSSYKMYTKHYPSIYENCATVNSAVYDTLNHSGTFISCMQSAIIFKNCFTNCTIYADSQLGVFVGAIIGCADGFYYPYNEKKTFVNSYFENCYTSGSIEGKTQLGGFVGMIFNDGRAYDVNFSGGKATHYRGAAVFKNCYSTSSVGMQYAGNYVGGFAGIVVGNIQGDKEQFGKEVTQHICENCYAAGEVGGITTDTSKESKANSIGGFIGAYYNYSDDAYGKTPSTNNFTSIDNVNNAIQIINSYYDKQTTAMRERDVGYYTYMDAEAGTLYGLTGVYTLSSSEKKVAGLTDTVNIMGDAEAWDNSMEDYYPQLKVFFNYKVPENYELSDAVKEMYDKRAKLYRNYALASTATVLLDHYDQYLNVYGELVDADPLVYDTVRDITSKFEFTTDPDNDIVWDNYAARNAENGYINTIDSEGEGFNVEYAIIDANGDETTAIKNHNPAVLKIVLDTTEGEQYKCTEFAPGRQWVMVTAGKGDTVGQRDLRLLPTAYLSAGGTMEVNVVYKDNALTNTVTLDGKTLPGFNHYAGVAYALTDKNRMGSITSDQTVSRYTGSSKTDSTSFAFYSGYLISGDSNAVGLDADTGEMYAQKFANNIENNSTNGMTMVKVYTTTKKVITAGDGSQQYLLEEGTEISDSEELAKWSGESSFDVDDTGYYYMKYYWRLNDGRYLTDYKLVKIKSSSHTVEIITGIINKEHKIYDGQGTEGLYTAIDQYVTDNITTSGSGDTWEKAYFQGGNPEEFYDGTYEYNTAKLYGNDVYYVKSKKIMSTVANSVVGWRRTSDYRLTTLIVEAQTPDGEWVEMARVDENSPTFDFSSAKYQYQYSGYTVEQNPETKLFTVQETHNNEKTFTVKNDVAASGIESYIEFEFASDDNIDTNYDSSDSIRVTALFRENYADIQAEKYVLLNPEKELTQLKTVTRTENNEAVTVPVYNSLEDADEAYEVDDTGIDNDDTRKAVLAGDILTYRLKLYNAGYYDSGEVNVTDELPEGCAYVQNSMKIYRQVKDITSGTAYYEELECKVELDESLAEDEQKAERDGYSVQYDNGTLYWKIPTVELDCDYYVEYQVRVSQLDANQQKALLTNTAVWDFIMLNGDLDLDDEGTIVDTSTSITHYQENAIFTMSVKEDETDQDNVTYEITFEQNTAKAQAGISYEKIQFTNVLPQDFEFADTTIDLLRGDVTIKQYNPDEIMDLDNNSFTIKDFDFDPNYTYLVRFTGTRLAPTSKQEVVNKASIYYDKVTDTKTQRMANSITKVTRLTNQVETDVTHLYLNVEKTIAVSDASQTFLFRIDRFENEAAAKEENAQPLETFYTQLHCINAVSDEDDNITAYQGSKLVQTDKRGYYVVTEVTDWSDTDYDFDGAAYTDVQSYKTVAGTATAVNDGITVHAASVGFAFPRQQYVSQAFPTSMGTLESSVISVLYPTARFTNEESIYAYLSGQAYAENTINGQKDITGGTD